MNHTKFIVASLLFFISQVSLRASLLAEKCLDSSLYGYTAELKKQLIFDQFTLTDTSVITSFDWLGQYSDGLSAIDQAIGDFYITLSYDDPTRSTGANYVNLCGQPIDVPNEHFFYQTLISASGVGTGFTDPLQGGEIKKWSADIPEIQLGAGSYWVSIFAVNSPDTWFLWNRSAQEDAYTVTGEIQKNGVNRIVASWDDGAMAYSVHGRVATVPDASNTVVLMVLSSCLLVAGKRFKRAA